MEIPERNEEKLSKETPAIYIQKEDYNLNESLPEDKAAILWAFLASYMPSDEKSIQKFFVQHAEYSLAQTRQDLMHKNCPHIRP